MSLGNHSMTMENFLHFFPFLRHSTCITHLMCFGADLQIPLVCGESECSYLPLPSISIQSEEDIKVHASYR